MNEYTFQVEFGGQAQGPIKCTETGARRHHKGQCRVLVTRDLGELARGRLSSLLRTDLFLFSDKLLTCLLPRVLRAEWMVVAFDCVITRPPPP